MKPDYNYILFQGNLERLSSFSIVNRILIGGLKSLGYNVKEVPTDSNKRKDLPGEIPDLYIFHGHPYDYVNAPGRFNIFILNYEYFEIKKEDRVLIDRLNNYFDLVLVSTNFVREILIKNRLTTPVELLPWGVDRSEFNPDVKPREIKGLKGFNFIYAGVFTERKGIDILVEAFINEFSAGEDVSLVLKEAMRWRHFEPWIEKVMMRAKNKSAPKIIHINRADRSIAGYFTACDAGVFPFRGEGFGLPILECIASGRRVLVTKGTGPVDFCNEENSLFIKAHKHSSRGKMQLRPDVRHLSRLMREAFNKGRLTARERRKIVSTVSGFTWQGTISRLRSIIDRELKPLNEKKERESPGSDKKRVKGASPEVCYTFFEKGLTSWRKTSARIDAALGKSFKNYSPVGFRAKPVMRKTDVVIGQSGFSLEQFMRAVKYNPGVLKVLYRESGPLENMLGIGNRERRICGVEERDVPAMELWRQRAELETSDRLLLFCDISKKLFIDSGYTGDKIEVLRLGINVHKPVFRKRRKDIRFLFVGTDSYRKGIRILLEAWDQLKLKRAELICITDDLLQSRLLLGYLVRNDNIKIKPLMPYRKFLAEYENADSLILPSFEDVFPFVIGEGMGYGKPAILSADTGTSEILTHKHDGLVVETGSVESLKEAILYMCDNSANIKLMGEAAYETAVKFSWNRFEKCFCDLISRLYDERR
jgi:glycosyltransferase involved in cell wall biosynthesis